MSDHFEFLDIYKALISLLAGLILGFEREMKDKSAGLKTITVICLGSTLFTILSYKMAGSGDPTRIASYIVSGIGFLGAGVIFKLGFNVYGLTTAGIIWIAAAIGMAIGFGEIYMAFTFLLAALVIIYLGNYITKNFLPQKHNRILKLTFAAEHFAKRNSILAEIKSIADEVTETAFEKEGSFLKVTLEMHITTRGIRQLEDFLMKDRDLVSFSY